MKQDEIIEMAIQAGLVFDAQKPEISVYPPALLSFAKLVAAKEQDRICRQIAVLHDSIMLASHATLNKKEKANEDK